LEFPKSHLDALGGSKITSSSIIFMAMYLMPPHQQHYLTTLPVVFKIESIEVSKAFKSCDLNSIPTILLFKACCFIQFPAQPPTHRLGVAEQHIAAAHQDVDAAQLADAQRQDVGKHLLGHLQGVAIWSQMDWPFVTFFEKLCWIFASFSS
jgi:hypothetical protein